jgi:RNA polymerase sigma factor (sigma-70 family)
MLGYGESSDEYGVMPNPDGDGGGARFEAFYRDHYLEMSGYVRRRVAEHDASDVIGEIFAVAWRRFDQIPSPPDDRLWLFGVARRCVADNRRSGVRRWRLHSRLAQQSHQEAHSNEDPQPDHERVRQGIESLRLGDREVLQLVLWDELSHSQAAALLGCSVNAFELRYRRAKKRLREALGTQQNAIELITPPIAPRIATSEAWRIYPT